MADVIWNWSERQKEIILDSTVYNTLSLTTREPLHDLLEPFSAGMEILIDQRDAVKVQVHDIEEIQVERNR